jgi:hypothetical protein
VLEHPVVVESVSAHEADDVRARERILGGRPDDLGHRLKFTVVLT